jgi:hypothetical protein
VDSQLGLPGKGLFFFIVFFETMSLLSLATLLSLLWFGRRCSFDSKGFFNWFQYFSSEFFCD